MSRHGRTVLLLAAILTTSLASAEELGAVKAHRVTLNAEVETFGTLDTGLLGSLGGQLLFRPTPELAFGVGAATSVAVLHGFEGCTTMARCVDSRQQVAGVGRLRLVASHEVEGWISLAAGAARETGYSGDAGDEYESWLPQASLEVSVELRRSGAIAPTLSAFTGARATTEDQGLFVGVRAGFDIL